MCSTVNPSCTLRTLGNRSLEIIFCIINLFVMNKRVSSCICDDKHLSEGAIVKT